MKGFTHEDYLKIEQNPKAKKFLEEENKSYMETYEKVKSEVDKKHDVIFKRILSNKKEVAKFIYKKFKIKVDPEDLEEYTQEFINKGGRKLLADVIYKIKGRKIFFLIEHQTKNYYHMSFKILNYEVEIMRTCSGSNKEEKEALVLAAVIHTGGDKWTAPRTIRELQEDIYGKGIDIPGDLQTLGNYALEDVNDYSKEDLLKSDSLLDKGMYLEKTMNTKDFIESIINVYEKIEKEDYEIMDEIIRIALSGNMTAMEIEIFIAILNGREEKSMLALKERIDAEFRGHRERGRLEGIAEGKITGLLKGERAGKIEDAKNMLKKNIDIDLIEEITGLKREQFM